MQRLARCIFQVMRLNNFVALPLCSQSSIGLLSHILLDFSYWSRRVVLSTSVAQTSLTLRDIRFVVDSGIVKRGCLDVLNDKICCGGFVSDKAITLQRVGRVGRGCDGRCIRMYQEAV